MFNRNSFDRSAFDRSTSPNNIEALWRGSGQITIGLVVNTTIDPWELSGKGNLNVGLVLEQRMMIPFTGEGNLSPSPEIDLRLRLSCLFNGNGYIESLLNFIVPTSTMKLSSSGTLTSTHLNFDILTSSNMIGTGNMSTQLRLLTSLEGTLEGKGELNNLSIRLPMHISGSMTGEGGIILSRLGALNTDTLEFTGLNLRPGETITIDTDELLVFLNSIEDVSSVTSDSVFFQLQPGDNEISFVTNGTPNLDVLIIYSNRWL